jgi:predicted regulator of Ras-like GTPase activity (Roadblock/LC7/MglB family)
VPDIKMKDILSEMAGELAGTWVIIVADNDGMLLSSWSSPDNKLPPEMLAGFIQTINEAIDAFKQSTAGFGKLDDVIFSTDFSYQVIKPIADGACFMVVNAPKTVPLGMIRMAVKNYTPRLEQVLPGYESLPSRNGMGTVVHST